MSIFMVSVIVTSQVQLGKVRSRLSVVEMNMDKMVEKEEVIYKRYCPDYPNSESDTEGM